MSVIHSFLAFLKHPQFQENSSFSFKIFFQSYAWAMFFSFIGMIIIVSLTVFLGDELSNANSEIAEQALEEGSFDILISLFFAAVIMAPILEEILFRLPLTSKRWAWYVWLVISPFIISNIFFTVNIFTEDFWKQIQETLMFQDFYLVPISQLMLCILGIGLAIEISQVSQAQWKRSILHLTPWIVYVLSLGFGILHLVNFSDLPFLLYGLGIFLVFPQIMAGFIMSFIRVQQGLILAILFHALYNGLLLTPIATSFWLMEGDDMMVESGLVTISIFLIVSLYGVSLLTFLGWSIRDAWRYEHQRF